MPSGIRGTVWLWAGEFTCRVCGLLLQNPPELDAADLDRVWEIKGADPLKYESPPDDASAYEAWRESREE